MRIKIPIDLYHLTVYFFVNCNKEDVLKNNIITWSMIEVFNMFPYTDWWWLTARDWWDTSKIVCFIPKLDLKDPTTYNYISHEVYHIVDKIADFTWLEVTENASNEHLAYLTWYITKKLFTKLL